MAGRDLDILDNFKPEKADEVERKIMDDMSMFDFEIFNHRMQMIALEGKEVFLRLGATIAVLAADLNVAIYTRDGDMGVCAPGVWMHAVTGQIPAKYVLKHWTNDPTVGVRDGDIFYNTEPLYGATHTPDQIIFLPIFAEGELVAWAGAVAHQESGATDPLGMPPDAKNRYYEGMKIPPIKIGENFNLKADITTMIENMVRDPRGVILDTKAKVAGCMRIRQRIIEMVKEKGIAYVRGGLRKMIEEAALAARRKIALYNDGVYEDIQFLDRVGLRNSLVRIKATLIKKGDQLTLDVTGSSPEALEASTNCFCQMPYGALAGYVLSYAFHDLPPSVGLIEAIDVIDPDGCLFNAGPDTPVSGGLAPAFVLQIAIHNAFSKMIFDSTEKDIACASWGLLAGVHGVGGINQMGVQFANALPEINAPGSGGRSTGDGEDVAGAFFANCSDIEDVEAIELWNPLLYLYRRYLIDGHGFGKHRGGNGIDACYVVHNVPFMVEAVFSLCSKIPCPGQGLFGGYAGNVLPGVRIRNSNIYEMLESNGKMIPRNTRDLLLNRTIEGKYSVSISSRTSSTLRSGDVFVYMAGGGAGYGDVLEREPAKVLEDLKRGFITPRTVREVYKVAIDLESMTVVEEETEELRRQDREKRLAESMSYEEFSTWWSQQQPREALLKHYGPWPDAWPPDLDMGLPEGDEDDI